MMVFSAAAEVISLGLVLPFIAALAAPTEVLANPLVADVASRFGVETADRLVIALTLAFSIAAIAAGLFRILVVWSNTRWTFATGADLSLEVYRRTLYQPYRVHVSRSSSEMISGITGKIGHTTLGVLLPLLVLTTSCILILAIAFTLLLIDPVVSGFAMVAFGGSYLLVTRIARRRLRRNSGRIAEEHTQVVKVLQEGLGGIRDVLLDGTQPVYCEIYKTADRRWRLAQGENVFIAQSPRFVIEALGMVLIAGLAFWLSRQAGGVAAALPVLGALAVGAQRLLPTMQQGYAAWANISGSRSSFADTIALLDQDMPEDIPTEVDPLRFRDSVRFESVCFRYQPEARDVLSNVDLTIRKGTRVGIVGATGSGKSTLLDLLMGLLTPLKAVSWWTENHSPDRDVCAGSGYSPTYLRAYFLPTRRLRRISPSASHRH